MCEAFGGVHGRQAAPAALFRPWIAAGLMRADVPPEFLAWEPFSPVAYIRILRFHGHATEAERTEGRRLAAAHAEFFIASALREQRDADEEQGSAPTAGGEASQR